VFCISVTVNITGLTRIKIITVFEDSKLAITKVEVSKFEISDAVEPRFPSCGI